MKMGLMDFKKKQALQWMTSAKRHRPIVLSNEVKNTKDIVSTA